MKQTKKRVNRSLGGDVFVIAVLSLFALVMALPLIYVISSAFKPYGELFRFPPTFFVRNPTLNNFKQMGEVLSSSWVPFSRYVINSLFITAVGVILQILFASFAAYGLTKFDFPGRNFLFQTVVFALMFSSVVTSIPTYLILTKLHMIDTYWAVILPAAQTSMGLYLMRQFMQQLLPDSLLEAARIDGANEIQIIFRIAMPVVKPAWLTLAILSIQSLWNATGGDYIYSEQLKTLPVALHQIVASGVARTGVGSAVSLCMMIVPVGTFLIAQSSVMETMATSGMKD